MVLERDQEPIIAQCTPSGKGAIALLRISGINVRELVSKFVKLPQKNINQLASHTVHYGFICNEIGEHIDQVMLIIMDAPKTFTGQDVIEITCHNNPFLIDSIIMQAIYHGARLAHEGEFTKRSFLNGKIDLVQAEAINELIHANTQLALKKSLAQLEGSFSFWINNLEHNLVKTLAWCEASFEFLDEEEEFGLKIKQHLETLINNIKDQKKSFNAQQQIKQGIRIALIGSVNAGKSSIFNSLLNQKRAIVAEIAGTTRDVIEAGLYRNGNYWTLVDTAGLRQTNDIIEKEGIKRSLIEAQKADIIVLVFDGSRNLNTEEYKVYNDILSNFGKKIILVQNKIDINPCLNHSLERVADLQFSSTAITSNYSNKYNDQLEEHISNKILELFTLLESPFLLNNRQHALLLSLEKKLENIITMLCGTVQYELVSYHLKDALETISELTGKSVSEAGMDMVFKEFCVGK